MKKPRRIIKKPTRRKLAQGEVLDILCDDGKIYTMTALAATVPITQSGLSCRLKRLGWDHPQILKKTGRISPDQQPEYKTPIVAGDLAHLSDKKRKSGLAKIPGPGLFDS